MSSPSSLPPTPSLPTAPDPFLSPGESLTLSEVTPDEESLNGLLDPERHEVPIGTNTSDAATSWWKKPAPWWLLCLTTFSAIGGAATVAARIETYTLLVCKVHSPDTYSWNHSLNSVNMGFWHRFLVQTQETPSRQQRCSSDPLVQAAVAELIAVIAASTGILSCLTGAWWGAFSDRHGRTSVLCITVLGALVADINLVLVTLFTENFPGGYWFLIFGPLVEGALGGLASGAAASHAYLADTTTEGSRSRIFSLSLGLLFTGFAIGPVVGSLLVRLTGQVLSVFFLAASIHISYALIVSLVVPESLTKQQRQASQEKYHSSANIPSSNRFTTNYMKGLFRFLAPLTILIPRVMDPVRRTRDWSLTLTVLAYGFTIFLVGSSNYVFQYASATFSWNSEDLGYFITVIGTVRAIVLMVIFPAVVKYLKPQPIIVESPSPASPLSEEEPLLSGQRPNITGVTPKELHSPVFDLSVARICVALEVLATAAMSLSRKPVPFLLASILGSAGSCVSPALQSLALAIHTRNGHMESGRLFGAISVVQALGSQIIAPSLYGFVYAKTVAWFPQSIFIVTMSAFFISLCCLSMVRLPTDSSYKKVMYSDLEGLDADEETPGRLSVEPSIPIIRITTVEN